ncbi:MAG: N,N-dimethylformamidase beta subunit family domain-containing protein, partial [Pirellula staleyi]
MTRKQTPKPVKKKNQSRAGHRRRRLQFESLEERDLLASNAIALENQLPGNPPSQWDIVGVGDTSIQGFATDISVGQGAPISFKINNVSRAPYRLDIYRIGYYAGNGARQVATIPSSQTIRTVQPAPLTNPTLGLIDAGNWSVSATWNVPANATSGVYIA